MNFLQRLSLIMVCCATFMNQPCRALSVANYLTLGALAGSMAAFITVDEDDSANEQTRHYAKAILAGTAFGAGCALIDAAAQEQETEKDLHERMLCKAQTLLATTPITVSSYYGTSLRELDAQIDRNHRIYIQLLQTKIELGIACRRFITNKKTLPCELRHKLQDRYEALHARTERLANMYRNNLDALRAARPERVAREQHLLATQRPRATVRIGVRKEF